MVPQEVIVVDQIPRTPSGKLDEPRLLEEYAARSAAARPERQL